MIGKKVYFFNSLPSTNTYIYENIRDFKHGDIVVAKTQTKGRGRRNHRWVSLDGNLHFSFLYESKKYTDFSLVVMTSLATVLALNEFGVSAQIKYPNDIVVNKGKIAGILIEKTQDKYIVGVGINVLFHDIENYEFFPTSIFLETSKIVDYRDVLTSFINHFTRLETESFSENFTMYKKLSTIIGKQIKTNKLEGKCIDINANGDLLLESGKMISGANEIIISGVYHG